MGEALLIDTGGSECCCLIEPPPPVTCGSCEANECTGTRIVNVVGMIAQLDPSTYGHLADTNITIGHAGDCRWVYLSATGSCFSIDAGTGQSTPQDCNETVQGAVVDCRLAGSPNGDPFADSYTVFVSTAGLAEGGYCYISTVGHCPQNGIYSQFGIGAPGKSFVCAPHTNPDHTPGSISVT